MSQVNISEGISTMTKNTVGYRTGAFSALNSGEIIGCVSNIKLSSDKVSCGFAYDNSGVIRHSVTLKVPKNNGKRAGFCLRNRGNIESSAWVKYKSRKEKVSEDSRDEKIKKYLDEEFRETEKLSEGELYKKLGLASVWKDGEEVYALIPDRKLNYVEPPCDVAPAREIKDADELIEIAARINEGDEDAASAHYILTENINLGGKEIEPIGINEQLPFKGYFDGNCKTISNFTIKAENREFSGFFGYVKDGSVTNLTVDYILKGKGGNVAGGMVAFNDGGSFINCHVRIAMSATICSGGFAGKNSGLIKTCYVTGALSAPIAPVIFTSGAAALIVLLLSAGGIIAYIRLSQSPYNPADKIDINAAPVEDDGPPVDPPPPGSNRISFEVMQEISISYATKVGIMNYVNPKRSTQDVVVSLCVSDKELMEKGIDLVASGVRTKAEMEAEGYDPTKALTTLYQSGRLPIGYKLEALRITALPDKKTHLGKGDYDMIIVINAYDPETQEKAVINAQAPVLVRIVD